MDATACMPTLPTKQGGYIAQGYALALNREMPDIQQLIPEVRMALSLYSYTPIYFSFSAFCIATGLEKWV